MTSRSFHLLATGLLLLCSSAQTQELDTEPYAARVVKVIDGDSVLLCTKIDNPTCNRVDSFEVGLWGIDAPEYDPYQQKFGDVATDYLKEEIENKIVVVEDKGQRADDTPQVEIFAPKRTPASLNLAMLFEGLAWTDPTLDEDVTEYQKAQEHAQSNRLGLWIAHEPSPPWVFREEVEELRK